MPKSVSEQQRVYEIFARVKLAAENLVHCSRAMQKPSRSERVFIKKHFVHSCLTRTCTDANEWEKLFSGLGSMKINSVDPAF